MSLASPNTALQIELSSFKYPYICILSAPARLGRSGESGVAATVTCVRVARPPLKSGVDGSSDGGGVTSSASGGAAATAAGRTLF
jgi:hypothetical protein